MITQVRVVNYKSIKQLEMAAKPFMVLVGPNGSGKTNVVRAMQLLASVLERGTTAPIREQGWPQVVRREKKPARGGLRLGASFKNERVRVQVSITLKGKVGSEDVDVVCEDLSILAASGSNLHFAAEKGSINLHGFGDTSQPDPALLAVLFPGLRFRPPDQHKHYTSRLKERLQLLCEEEPQNKGKLRLLTPALGAVYFQILRECTVSRLRLDASALRSDARYQANGTQPLGPSGEGLPVAVDRLRERGTEPAEAFRPILDTLREVYPRIVDVLPESFGQGRVTLNFRERGIAEPIPLDGVSDGVLHALALLIALGAHQQGVLAIEEPENALHPWSVRKILRVAQEARRGQVLVTTHSESVVNAVENPESLFIVEADDQRGTTVEPATSKDEAILAILQESGQKLGEVWVGGSLGGVPRGGE